MLLIENSVLKKRKKRKKGRKKGRRKKGRRKKGQFFKGQNITTEETRLVISLNVTNWKQRIKEKKEKKKERKKGRKKGIVLQGSKSN